MNKKGEMNGVGIILAVFVGLIVALALYTSSAGFIGTATNTIALSQGQYTLPANGACKDLVGQELLSTPIVLNRTSATDFSGLNHTIAEGVSSVDGLKRIRVCSTGVTIQDSAINGLAVNVSYTYGPEGYIDSSGGRSVALLIPILAALAIAVIALFPTLRSGIMDMVS